jgi:hypothetical protein
MYKAKYGFESKAIAERCQAKLQEQYPEHRYEVALHDSRRRTWGVMRYVPYCDKMPLRCTGFIDFNGHVLVSSTEETT